MNELPPVAGVEGMTMYLPPDAFSIRFVQGRIAPRWLGEKDEAFVSGVLESIIAFDGLTVGEAEIVSASVLPNRIAEGIWTLERRRWTTELDAPIAPEKIRATLFEMSAKVPRAEALILAAGTFGASPEVLLASLFADRATRRRLRAAEPAALADVIARYNLAVIQTLLSKAMEVEALFYADPRPIVRAAKRDGLIVQLHARENDERVRLQLAGPLALFHDTAKYGRSLARFVPSLVAAPGWSLRAAILTGGQRAELAVAESDGVAFACKLASTAAEPVARRLAKTLRGGGVRVNLAPPALRAGDRLVLPDFALEWPERRVSVDVLPFTTPEQLESTLALAAKLDGPMLVCVDERYTGERASPMVVPYRRTIDPWRLLDAAQKALNARAA